MKAILLPQKFVILPGPKIEILNQAISRCKFVIKGAVWGKDYKNISLPPSLISYITDLCDNSRPFSQINTQVCNISDLKAYHITSRLVAWMKKAHKAGLIFMYSSTHCVWKDILISSLFSQTSWWIIWMGLSICNM